MNKKFAENIYLLRSYFENCEKSSAVSPATPTQQSELGAVAAIHTADCQSKGRKRRRRRMVGIPFAGSRRRNRNVSWIHSKIKPPQFLNFIGYTNFSGRCLAGEKMKT
ncbi:unnamed protein product [Citrullus colocynthis]|uniref:Uncharacterized protein n=1 Tax=Citrullus colocynthis TaxID=252529 RepID=A0ABP0YGV1_9ROSI